MPNDLNHYLDNQAEFDALSESDKAALFSGGTIEGDQALFFTPRIHRMEYLHRFQLIVVQENERAPIIQCPDRFDHALQPGADIFFSRESRCRLQQAAE